MSSTMLVTGGAGFIGSHLVDRLLRDGHTVRVLDNFSSGKRENLAHLAGDLEIIEGDIRDAGTVRCAVQGVDVVFHEAAVASVPASIADPETTYSVNINGTLNVLLAARDSGVRRVVFASSSAVYGNSPEMPKVETMTPGPLSPYAISKLTGEQTCAVFTSVYGLETVALRYFNVFGPRQDPNSQYAAVIPKFLGSLQQGESPTIFGDGEQSRDFIFIDNVVNANLLAAEAPEAAGKVFNIASGQSVSINQMFRMVAERLGMETRANYAPSRVGDVRDSLADISQARQSLGYDAVVSFEEGLSLTAQSVTEVPAY